MAALINTPEALYTSFLEPSEPNLRLDNQMAEVPSGRIADPVSEVPIQPAQPKVKRLTTDTEVRQALQDAMNIVMRWDRLQETSVKYRSQQQWGDLTKFFRKSFYEVWVDGMGQPMMLPEDAVATTLATAVAILALDVLPEKQRAMETAFKKGRR